MRISRQQMYMDIASVVAKRATCFRLNVGAVVVVNNHAVSFGYNGPPAGEEHCTGNDCPGRHGCLRSLHAEANAIDRIPLEYRDPLISKDLYVTDSPCFDCTNKIRTSGIRRVFFATPYRINDHLSQLWDSGILVYRVTPAGYIMDWFTKDVVNVEA